MCIVTLLNVKQRGIGSENNTCTVVINDDNIMKVARVNTSKDFREMALNSRGREVDMIKMMIMIGLIII